MYKITAIRAAGAALALAALSIAPLDAGAQQAAPDESAAHPAGHGTAAAAEAAKATAQAQATAAGTHAKPLTPEAAAEEARNWFTRNSPLIKRTWGVEILGVHLASSNWMINFKFRILDPDKARILLDAKSTAYLVDESSGARLAVPAMENIGELRQVNVPKAGRDYYIVFGNGSQVVRKGSRVDVVVGAFHADGLIVE